MAEEKKKDPPKGDFIDLEKTEFKKKNNIIGFLIKFIFLGLIFFGLGIFVNQKYRIPLDLNTKKSSEQISESKHLIELQLNLDILKNDIEEISEKLKDTNLTYKNIENKNRELIQILNEITERVRKAEEIGFTSSFKKELNQYEILKNLILLKKKFDNRQVIKKEISIISSFFDNDFEVLTLLNYFSEINLPSIVKKNYLLNEINTKIQKYDLQLEDFFEKVNNRENLDRENVFEFKERFFNYLDDIFSSTFKITKYESTEFEENIEKGNNYKEILMLSKEYLIIGNINEAVNIIEQSGLDLIEFKDWIEKGSQLSDAKNKLDNLEELVLKKLANYND